MTILRRNIWHISWNSNDDSDQIIWWCPLVGRIHSDQTSLIHRWKRFQNEHKDVLADEGFEWAFLEDLRFRRLVRGGRIAKCWVHLYEVEDTTVRWQKGMFVLMGQFCGIIETFLFFVRRLVTSMSMWFGSLRYRVVSFLWRVRYDNSQLFLCLILFPFSWTYKESPTEYELRRPLTKSNIFVSCKKRIDMIVRNHFVTIAQHELAFERIMCSSDKQLVLKYSSWNVMWKL